MDNQSTPLMDERTRQNWQKIKTALEESNKTNCYLYQRACSIVKTGTDPMSNFLNNS
jgi:hypothetical protein